MSQSQLNELRDAARKIFDAAVRSVDAREATRRALNTHHRLLSHNRPIYALCIGKAAIAMSVALEEVLGDRIRTGLVTGEAPADQPLSRWSYFAGGHPLPNEESLRGAEAAFELLNRANAEGAVVIFGISGGGSAMIESPVSSEISLHDLQEANRILVTCGATIAEINTVRRAFSRVKGGKLAGLVPDAEVVTFIVSDTNRGDEANVASGPTLGQIDLTFSAKEIVERFQLASRLPHSILLALEGSRDVVPIKQSTSFVLADNQAAIDAASSVAKEMGFTPVVAADIIEQAIDDGCKMLVQRLMKAPGRVCLISGGEFACPVNGDGIGGRNSETVLRCAIELSRLELNHSVVVLSGGTDGVDGNSPATGAIADNTSLARAVSLNMDPLNYLARSDSFTFFDRLGDAIITGPTGTNVRDIRLLLSG